MPAVVSADVKSSLCLSAMLDWLLFSLAVLSTRVHSRHLSLREVLEIRFINFSCCDSHLQISPRELEATTWAAACNLDEEYSWWPVCWILVYKRLEIWHKIGLSGDWCLCTVLRTRSGACYYWIGSDSKWSGCSTCCGSLARHCSTCLPSTSSC